MSEQRFPAGATPRIRISRVRGDLRVEVWDEDAILIDCDSTPRELYQEGDELAIETIDDDLELRVPARTAIALDTCDGDVEIEGVRRVEIERVSGDLDLSTIGEEAVVGAVAGDLSVEQTPALIVRTRVAGDVSLDAVQQAFFADIDGSLEGDGVENLGASNIGGDLKLGGLTGRLGAVSVGGDLQIDANGGTIGLSYVGGDVAVDGSLSALQVGEVGGDLALDGPCAQLNVGQLGGDLELVEVGELRVGNVGGDLEVVRITALAEIGNVGGDAELTTVDCPLSLGNVGGDLELRASFLPGTRTSARVGGDASVTFLSKPDLTLTAIVSGEVRGADVAGSTLRRVSLRYGSGEASLDLTVGGDLRIGGGFRPENSRAAGVMNADNEEWGRHWRDFSREMSELSRELGTLGREIGDEIAAALAKEGISSGAAWGDKAARKLEEQARKLEEQARKLEGEGRRGRVYGRMHVRINDREWQLDPERLERIKEQARRAAADGLSGALEAVERAIGRLRTPPVPPVPPVPPTPAPPGAPAAPGSPQAPATGQTIKIELDDEPVREPAPAPMAAPTPDAGPPATLEQERETILRMIAEGRISPEEGDLLLEALGS